MNLAEKIMTVKAALTQEERKEIREALLKQIPEEPMMRYLPITRQYRNCCPRCQKPVEKFYNEKPIVVRAMACECGQRIKWVRAEV